MKAASELTIWNDSGLDRFTVFVPSFGLLSVDVGTTAGNRIKIFWGVFTGFSIAPSLGCYDSSSNDSEAGGVTCNVFGRVS